MLRRYNGRKALKSSSLVYAMAFAAAILLVAVTAISAKSLSGTPDGSFQNLMIRLSISVVEVVLWLIAFHCAVRFKRYANSIKQSKDGKSLGYVANGLLLLVVYIVALGLSVVLLDLVRDAPYRNMAIAAKNYLPLGIALASSLYLYVGSRRLAGLVGSKGRNHRREQGYKVLFGIFALLFAINFYLHATQVRGDYGMPRFTFPINILMFSYLLPSIVMWALGLLACANLAWYARHTPGTIYKRLFRNLYQGILTVLLSIFMFQLLLISPLVFIGMSSGIMMIYGILFMAIFGFVLVYRGAQKLAKLEAVDGASASPAQLRSVAV